MKLTNVALVSLAAVFATGCFGRGAPGPFFAPALLATAIIGMESHTEQEHPEPEEVPVYPGEYVVDPQMAFESAPPPAPPAAPPFDANAARNALASVDLAACRAAGAPRGYGHAKVTVIPSGDISRVVIEEPSGMSPAATQCIGAAIGRVTVPEFGGRFVTVGTTFFVP